MNYSRPQNNKKLTPEEKKELLQDYTKFYQNQYQVDPASLNKKIPRAVFEVLLNKIGGLLLEESARLSKSDPVVQKFLADTPLPPPVHEYIPDDFRVFCLALNALKQWLSAEQGATDRYLLGGTARDILRSVVSECIVTGEEIDANGELHHPVRDGRPPIYLSKAGHSKIEGQTKKEASTVKEKEDSAIDDPINASDASEIIKQIKKDGHHSWVQLRKACASLLGKEVSFSTPAVKSTSLRFARKIFKQTGMSYQNQLEWVNRNFPDTEI